MRPAIFTPTPDGADAYVPGHGDLSFDVDSYELTLDYTLAGNRLVGKAVIHCRIAADPAADGVQHVEFDLHHLLKVTKLSVSGARVARFGQQRSRLFIRFEKPLAPGTPFVVTVQYQGTPGPMRGLDGDAGWEELTDGVIVASQPHGSPTWFPCNDRASSKARYRFVVTTDAGYTIVANGNLERRRHAGRRATWTYDAPQAMSPYLATLQIGPYQTRELRPAPREVRLVFPPRVREEVRRAFARQVDMIDFFSRCYGEYPFDSYTAVITDDDLEIPLESQTLSTFGANFATTDWQSQRLIAHELAHQWFGNALTAASWVDIWLHEGFACYSEWLWSEESGGPSADEQAREHGGRLNRLPQDLRLHDPGPKDMFDDRVYKRGALTLHALRRLLGDELFFALLKRWVAEHRYGLVTSEEFIELAEEMSGRPLAGFFRAWLDELPLPDLPSASASVGTRLR